MYNVHAAIYLHVSTFTDHTGIVENPISAEQHIRNCQIVIDLIAADVLNVDLSHISGNAIVEGDKVSIRNFLEIFAGLLEYFMEYIDDEGMHVCHCISIVELLMKKIHVCLFTHCWIPSTQIHVMQGSTVPCL